MREKHIVLLGNLEDGFKHIGPFDSVDNAIAWAECCGSNAWTVITLISPEDLNLDPSEPDV